jgi:D-alanyl-lipoteichoic acid acyltransferase DltB (MBOAT superfamily)
LINIGILFYFKYFNFFISSIADIIATLGINASLHTLKIILPVGISFYTFASLSYPFDIYLRKIEPTKDMLAYCAFASFFPALLSGPISRAGKQLPQYFRKREFRYSMMSAAFKAIVWGFFMKMCVADRLGIYVDKVYADFCQHSGASLFMAQFLYTIQIYADFAGYSLIAIGSGRFLGIELPTNFIRPYISRTLTEFWRKWHISLTTWFRDYVYFPLGGGYVSHPRWIFNTLVVFLISGLWHGAAYTFIIWGAIHGIIMVIEKLLYGDRLKSIASSRWGIVGFLQLTLTFTLVSFAWIFFRMNSAEDAICVIHRIFTARGSLFVDLMTFISAFASMAILFIKEISEECQWQIRNKSLHRVGNYALYTFLICFILLFGVLDGTQFIYFQF